MQHALDSQIAVAVAQRVLAAVAPYADGGWQIIDFQASQWGSRDGVSFTINLGSAVQGLPKLANWDEKKPPPEASTHLRQRIGDLLDGCDHWWDLDLATDTQALANELLAILRRVGLPWLEARSGLERVLNLISGRPEELGWHDLRMLPKLLADAVTSMPRKPSSPKLRGEKSFVAASARWD